MLIKSVTKSVNKPTSRTPLGNPCLLLVHWMESCPTVMVGSWDFNDFLICGGVVLEILMDHKFQWSQEGLNCKPFTCNAVTWPTKLRGLHFKPSCGHCNLRSIKILSTIPSQFQTWLEVEVSHFLFIWQSNFDQFWSLLTSFFNRF